jgi:hypothetical protein
MSRFCPKTNSDVTYMVCAECDSHVCEKEYVETKEQCVETTEESIALAKMIREFNIRQGSPNGKYIKDINVLSSEIIKFLKEKQK